MTESEWMAADHPKRMLAFIQPAATDRQFRLFNCACVRRVWSDLKDERLREAIRIAERHADGTVSRDDLGLAVTDANRARGKHDVTRAVYETVKYAPGGPYHAVGLVIDRVSWHVASKLVPDPEAPWGSYQGGTYVPIKPEAQKAWVTARQAEFAAHCQIIRDIFGNPFRSSSINHSWLVSTVLSVAETIYEERKFERMTELGYALQQAGCTSSDILAHCRESGPHVRGCWVIDLLLEKHRSRSKSP